MKIRRDIASVPLRSASETWQAVIDLITSTNSVDTAQLHAAASVMETVIAEELPARTPIVVSGCGSRLVIYCVFGEAALDLGTNVDALTWNPTGEGWKLAAPAAARDLAWMKRTLAERAVRITVYDAAVGLPDDRADAGEATKGFVLDWKGLID